MAVSKSIAVPMATISIHNRHQLEPKKVVEIAPVKKCGQGKHSHRTTRKDKINIKSGRTVGRKDQPLGRRESPAGTRRRRPAGRSASAGRSSKTMRADQSNANVARVPSRASIPKIEPPPPSSSGARESAAVTRRRRPAGRSASAGRSSKTRRNDQSNANVARVFPSRASTPKIEPPPPPSSSGGHARGEKAKLAEIWSRAKEHEMSQEMLLESIPKFGETIETSSPPLLSDEDHAIIISREKETGDRPVTSLKIVAPFGATKNKQAPGNKADRSSNPSSTSNPESSSGNQKNEKSSDKKSSPVRSGGGYCCSRCGHESKTKNSTSKSQRHRSGSKSSDARSNTNVKSNAKDRARSKNATKEKEEAKKRAPLCRSRSLGPAKRIGNKDAVSVRAHPPRSRSMPHRLARPKALPSTKFLADRLGSKRRANNPQGKGGQIVPRQLGKSLAKEAAKMLPHGNPEEISRKNRSSSSVNTKDIDVRKNASKKKEDAKDKSPGLSGSKSHAKKKTETEKGPVLRRSRSLSPAKRMDKKDAVVAGRVARPRRSRSMPPRHCARPRSIPSVKLIAKSKGRSNRPRGKGDQVITSRQSTKSTSETLPQGIPKEISRPVLERERSKPASSSKVQVIKRNGANSKASSVKSNNVPKKKEGNVKSDSSSKGRSVKSNNAGKVNAKNSTKSKNVPEKKKGTRERSVKGRMSSPRPRRSRSLSHAKRISNKDAINGRARPCRSKSMPHRPARPKALPSARLFAHRTAKSQANGPQGKGGQISSRQSTESATKETPGKASKREMANKGGHSKETPNENDDKKKPKPKSSRGNVVELSNKEKETRSASKSRSRSAARNRGPRRKDVRGIDDHGTARSNLKGSGGNAPREEEGGNMSSSTRPRNEKGGKATSSARSPDEGARSRPHNSPRQHSERRRGRSREPMFLLSFPTLFAHQSAFNSSHAVNNFTDKLMKSFGSNRRTSNHNQGGKRNSEEPSHSSPERSEGSANKCHHDGGEGKGPSKDINSDSSEMKSRSAANNSKTISSSKRSMSSRANNEGRCKRTSLGHCNAREDNNKLSSSSTSRRSSRSMGKENNGKINSHRHGMKSSESLRENELGGSANPAKDANENGDEEISSNQKTDDEKRPQRKRISPEFHVFPHLSIAASSAGNQRPWRDYAKDAFERNAVVKELRVKLGRPSSATRKGSSSRRGGDTSACSGETPTTSSTGKSGIADGSAAAAKVSSGNAISRRSSSSKSSIMNSDVVKKVTSNKHVSYLLGTSETRETSVASNSTAPTRSSTSGDGSIMNSDIVKRVTSNRHVSKLLGTANASERSEDTIANARGGTPSRRSLSGETLDVDGDRVRSRRVAAGTREGRGRAPSNARAGATSGRSSTRRSGIANGGAFERTTSSGCVGDPPSARETTDGRDYATRISWSIAPSRRGSSGASGISIMDKVKRAAPRKSFGDLLDRTTDAARTSDRATPNARDTNPSRRSSSGTSGTSKSRDDMVKKATSDGYVGRLLGLMDAAPGPRVDATKSV